MFMQRGLLLVFAVEFYRILNFYRGLVTPMLMGSFATALQRILSCNNSSTCKGIAEGQEEGLGFGCDAHLLEAVGKKKCNVRVFHNTELTVS